jgi:hypothetical protein
LRAEYEAEGLGALRSGLFSLDLWHGADFDPRYISRMPRGRADRHVAALRDAGAPPPCCRFVTSDREDEGPSTVELRAGVEAAFNDGTRAVLLSCIPGELAHMNGDFEEYILRRHPLS